MSSLTISLIVLACVFGGSLLGLYLRTVLPEHHLSEGSMGVVKLATGLIATLSALVLGLLISSAKGSFDKVNDEVVQDSAKVIQLDRVLANYGPETRELRDLIKRHYTNTAEALMSGDSLGLAKLDTPEMAGRVEKLQAGVGELSPRSDAQRQLKARALQIFGELSSSRWVVLLQREGSISMPLLVALVSWLVIIFTAFGLLAPRNTTVVVSLFICSLAAAGAIFLILEMDRPLDGMIRISGAPLRAALAHLGQ
jgi:hypothetical protein